MESIWMGIQPGAKCTRVIAMRGLETILRARLRPSPSSPQAIQILLESMALWEGRRVRAALVVDDDPESPFSSLYRDAYRLSATTSLYELDLVSQGRDHRRDVGRGTRGFGELQQLILFELAR